MLRAYRDQSPPIILPVLASPAVSARLQTAIKYGTKVCKTGAAGIEVHNLITVGPEITSDNTSNLTEFLPRF